MKVVRAPTLAQFTIEDEELRRLRREGMTLRERISIPKAGVTGAVLEKIYDQWRTSELVRLKFHESLVHNMKTAHEIAEVGGFDWFCLNYQVFAYMVLVSGLIFLLMNSAVKFVHLQVD